MYFNVILYWKCCSYNYTATVLYCTQMFFFFIIQYSIPSPPPLHFTFHHHYPLFPSPLAPTSLSYPFPPIQLLTHFTPLPSPLPLCNLPKGGGGGDVIGWLLKFLVTVVVIVIVILLSSVMLTTYVFHRKQ